MTKNKKKLRRAERRYSVTRTAQTLVLTGMLLAGGVVGAGAATEINGAATWDASAASGAIEYNGTTGNKAAVATSAANTTGDLTTLTITGADTAAALTAEHDLTFTGAVNITGASGNLGSLIISADKTVTTGGTTVGDYGTLDITGKHVGTLEATGANSSAIELNGLQVGNVTLNGAGAALTAGNDGAAVWGNVTVTEGTLNASNGSLMVKNADGTGLGNVTLGANSTLTLGELTGLAVGTLTVNKDTDVGGMLQLASLAGESKLTLNDAGTILFKDYEGAPTNATLAAADATTGLVLGDGGTLNAATLNVLGDTIAAQTGGNTTSIEISALELTQDTTFGAVDKGGHQMHIAGEDEGTPTTFLSGGNLTLVGAAGNEATLVLSGNLTSDKTITLAGAADTEAVLNVDGGNVTVGTVHVGSDKDIAGGGTGSIVVEGGSTFNASAVNLFGLTGSGNEASLTVGTGDKATIGTLTVGGTNTYGVVDVSGSAGENNTGTLSVNALNIGTNGVVNVGGYGILDIKGSFAIAEDKLAGMGVTAGGINVATNGTLHVQDVLHITKASDNITGAVDGTVMTDVLKAGDGTTQTFTWNGGTLNLLGDGNGTFLQAKELLVNNGATLNLGVANGPVVSGGTYSGKVTANAGTISVAKGEWTLSGTGANGLNVESAGAVKVNGGTLNVAAWDSKTTAAGSATVQNGSLNLTGGAASIKTDASDITASNAGAVTANYDAVLTDDTTLAGTVGTFAVTDTGVLTIKDRTSKTITLAEFKALKNVAMTGTGTFRLDGVAISDVDTSTKLSDVAGVSVAGNVVNLDVDTTLAGYGTEVKGLKADGTADKTVTVNGGLTMVGGGNGFQLSDNGDKATNISVGNGGLFMLGSAASTAPTYGILQGDITLDGAMAATKGTFVVGDITGSTNGTTLTLSGASLTAGAIDFATSGNTAIVVNTGSGLFATETSSVKAVTLDGGTFAVLGDDKDLTVAGAITISNGGVLSAGKDLILTGATIGILDGASIVAGNNIDATGKDLAAGAKGLGIQAKTATVKDLTGTFGKLTVIVSDKLTANTITANSDTASYIQVGELAVTSNVGLANNAALVITDATKDSTIGGTLTLGTAGTADSAASMSVAGKMTVTGDTDVLNGSSLNVNEFVATNGTTISVGNSTDTKGSSLAVNTMTLDGSTLFLDPSWVAGTEYQDAGTASRAAIKEFAAGIDGNLIAGQNSQLALGTANVEQLTSAIRQMGNVWGASGITAALGIYAPQELKAGGAITVNGAAGTTSGTFTANTAAFGENSLLVVDSKAGLGAAGALKGQTGTSILTVDATAKLHIIGGKANQTINIVSGFDDNNTGSIAAGGWDGTNLTSDTALLSPTRVGAFDNTTGKGTYSVNLGQNAATSVFPLLSSSMGGLVDTMVRDTGVDPSSKNTGIRFISRAVSDSYIGRNNRTEAAATIEGAAQLAAVGAVPGMTLGAMQAATNAVTTRTSFASPLLDTSKAVALHKDVVDGTVSLDSGLSAGDSMKNGIGLWIMPLYQSNSVWGMEAENFDTGYKSDLGGVALGVDYTINDAFRFGVGLNLGGGYAQSTGDFNKTQNSFNFWGVNLYGGWAQNNFGLTGDVGYTSSYNKLNQELPSSMHMDDIKSDVTSSAWTAGLRGEYKFATEALDIIPHVGVRYTGLTTDDYKAKSGGGTVFKVDQDFQSIWTFPVGVTFAKEITTDSGWTFRPQVDLGITPATGDVKAKSKVRVPGIDAAAEMKMQVVDYMSYDGGIGLEMKKDNVSFGINYNIQASEHRTGHGVFGTLRYEF